jgi:hypothetical protein
MADAKFPFWTDATLGFCGKASPADRGRALCRINACVLCHFYQQPLLLLYFWMSPPLSILDVLKNPPG